MISEGQTDSAALINNSIVPACPVEQNYKTFNKIYLETGMGRGVTLQQRDQLFSIANQCPLTGGYVVYQARTLLNLIMNSSLVFTDNCESQSAKKEEKHIKSISLIKRYIHLYPNPSNGTIHLNYTLGKDEIGKLIITDLSGRHISEYALQYDKTSVSVSEGALQNGIYFYEVWISGNRIHQDKLIIIR
jgi:hypothetical protein